MTAVLERSTIGAPARRSGFRDDINGLRAIAVCAVVLYHFRTGLVNGGYLGVDIFYVISGFLMTKIILGRLEAGRFRLLDFYVARVRRIVPALVVLCLAVCAVAALLIDPLSGETIGKDAAGSLGFVSNMLYATQGGYFARAQESNWLIHTWSLSVEWQFYLIYPVLLSAAFGLRRRPTTILVMILVGMAVSLALALAMSVFNGTTVAWGFYLFPSRAWEMCGGGLCAYVSGRHPLPSRLRAVAHVCGLVVAIVSCLAINSHFSVQPGWILIPVLGAMAVIASDITAPAWAANPVTAALGRWSYSIYLWHWPIVAGLTYWRVGFTAPVIAGGIAASVALGAVSYGLIERRLTDWLFQPRGPVLWGPVFAAFAAAVIFAAAVGVTHDFETLRDAGAPAAVKAVMADDRAAGGDWRWPAACAKFVKFGGAGLHLCYVGDPKARDTLVIGDSHMQQLLPRYAHAYPPGQGVSFFTASGCIPLPGVGARQSASICAKWVKAAYKLAEQGGYRHVVIGSMWTGYFIPEPGEPVGPLCFAEGGRGCVTSFDPARYHVMIDRAFDRFSAELSTLRREGLDVTVVEPFPQGPEADPLGLYQKAFFDHDLSAPPIDQARFLDRTAFARQQIVRAAQAAGVRLVDPVASLCPAGYCPVTAQGRALYKDDTHFRASAVTSPRFAFLDRWITP